jgi:hypothetical protein
MPPWIKMVDTRPAGAGREEARQLVGRGVRSILGDLQERKQNKQSGSCIFT